MRKRGLLPVMLVMVFALLMTGCDLDLLTGGGGYTFEFKVENSETLRGRTITKVEFINGSSRTDPVLETQTVHLGLNEMSNVYRVSGFTKKDGEDKRLFSVLITLEDGNTIFKYSSATNGSKIHAKVVVFSELYFYNGNW
jgi:hypothetical protein